MTEKINNEAIQGITLKDRVEYVSDDSVLKKNTENPVEKLQFQEILQKRKTYKIPKSVLSQNNVWIPLLVVCLIWVSMTLNSSFFKQADLKLFNSVKNLNNFALAQFSSPYVVTIGEYGNVSVAKDEAIKILPQFKQIDIKKLDSGLYTFEMDRFTSKNKAYNLAGKFTQDGFDAVHVRYLPKR